MRSIAGSGCQSMRSATASPATRRSAATMSPTLTLMPGTLIERRVVNADAGASWPTTRLSIAVRGDDTHILVCGDTGHSARSPASGSRMMPLANDDAALFGWPGRTVIVGRRSERPSIMPLRVMSWTSSSPIAFCVPYDDCGVSAASSGTGSGSAPPNTAIELVNTNFGGVAQLAAALEQVARRVEVDAHADVELGFGLPADDGGEVEHAGGVRGERRVDDGAVGDVAGDDAHARVVEAGGGHHVDEDDLAQRARLAAGVGQRPPREQRAGEAGAEEAGAAGDDDSHGGCPPDQIRPDPEVIAFSR